MYKHGSEDLGQGSSARIVDCNLLVSTAHHACPVFRMLDSQNIFPAVGSCYYGMLIYVHTSSGRTARSSWMQGWLSSPSCRLNRTEGEGASCRWPNRNHTFNQVKECRQNCTLSIFVHLLYWCQYASFLTRPSHPSICCLQYWCREGLVRFIMCKLNTSTSCGSCFSIASNKS